MRCVPQRPASFFAADRPSPRCSVSESQTMKMLMAAPAWPGEGGRAAQALELSEPEGREREQVGHIRRPATAQPPHRCLQWHAPEPTEGSAFNKTWRARAHHPTRSKRVPGTLFGHPDMHSHRYDLWESCVGVTAASGKEADKINRGEPVTNASSATLGPWPKMDETQHHAKPLNTEDQRGHTSRREGSLKRNKQILRDPRPLGQRRQNDTNFV